uniref:Leucine rich immune protein (Coil-less) n=1 Tax=Anopheles epiroticus TaxID=199890 RepID=A0A9I3FH41_9DIPT
MSISLCSLLVMFVSEQYVFSISLVCNSIPVCDIWDMKSSQDVFMNHFVPSDVKNVNYRNVMLDKLDNPFFDAIPGHVKKIHIMYSKTLTTIVLPAQGNISSFFISNTGVSRIEIDVRNVIVELSVDDGRLTTVPESISNLKESVKIMIEGCLIEALDMAAFCDLSKVQVINLNANRIRHIHNSATKHCSAYDSLLMLTLSYNLLKKLNIEVFNPYGKMQLLQVKKNRLIAVTDRFESEAPLQLLLRHNKLKSTDFCRWNVPRMESLLLDFNEITTVHTCLSSLSNITKLTLAYNKIKNVTIDSFANMHSLVTLDLSFNDMKTIVLKSLQYPRSLRKLGLVSNNLTELDLSLVPVPSLEVDVHGNCIEHIDLGSISSNVTSLDMGSNPVDCSWQNLEGRTNVTCEEYPKRKAECDVYSKK